VGILGGTGKNNSVELELTDASKRDLAQIIKGLRTLGDGKTIPKELRKTLRTAVNPVVATTKATARGLPSKGKKLTRGGLRRNIANATSLQIRLSGNPSVGVRVARKKLGTQGRLPQLMNRGSWEHPVYGMKDVTVTQTSKAGWFDDVMKASAPAVGRQVEASIKAMVEKYADE